MTGRGVYFALDPDDRTRVLDAASGSERFDIITAEFEERWDDEWTCEIDKASVELHSLFANDQRLAKCILGGRRLDAGEYLLVCYLTPAEVLDLSEALREIDEPWLHARSHDYTEDMLEYLWSYLVSIRRFFASAANCNRAVIFTVAR